MDIRSDISQAVSVSTINSDGESGALSLKRMKPRRSKQRQREIMAAYLFLAPALLLFIIFIAGPFVGALGLSFYSWDMFTPARFVGLANYAKLLTDSSAHTALLNTAIFTISSLVLHLVIGMLLALAVNRAISGVLKYFLRTAYFFPFIMSWASVSLMWLYLLDPNFGAFNYYLGRLGLPTPNWLQTTSLALPTLIMVDLWRTLGFTFMILLAGLSSVPPHFYEAARLDGAGPWQRFWHVTIPLMSPTLLFASVITIVGAFQIFDPMFIMTTGGPGTATLSIVLYIYQTGFQSFQMGYASTLALLVFLVIMLVTILQLRISRYWVFYE